MLDIVTEQRALLSGDEEVSQVLSQAQIKLQVNEGVKALAIEEEKVVDMTPEEKEARLKLIQKKKERAEQKAEHLREAA